MNVLRNIHHVILLSREEKKYKYIHVNLSEEAQSSGGKKKSSPNTEQNQPPRLPLCGNPGNPVFSCMLDAETLMINGSLKKPQVLLFKTTSSEYGAISPVSQMVARTYHPVDQTFSKHLLTCGSLEDSYLNTAIDRSRVYDHPNLQHTL
ncbi:PREDICTED: uncharacterized protein C15orf65 homolog [Charadrius vociferus]|uniref:uncharacterized protein C15orf65 homolog n=1 Tax=Charadrius vociferus TaxID=50402 RepID=UPI0005217185|nr:PREDICTED: uncharacterized protein C15orf65 homolog [Charadrius vociferus]